MNIWNLLQLACTDIYIARSNQGAQALRCNIHYSLVKRQLQLQEILPYALTAFPPEYGYGCEDLAAWSIGRQSAALASGMQQYAFFCGKPFFKALLRSLILMACLQKPVCPASATKS